MYSTEIYYTNKYVPVETMRQLSEIYFCNSQFVICKTLIQILD